MTTETVEAWVLHKRPSGDTSAQVTFFTREKGLLKCLAKGGRTPKRQALLQAFQPLWLAFDVRKDWYYSRHIEATATTTIPLVGHALFAGLYVNELLYYALNPLDPYPELYDAYLETLTGLTVSKERLEIEVLLRRFEWELLLSCGYSMSFTEAANGEGAIQGHYSYRFVATEGFVLSEKGQLSGRDLLLLAESKLDTPSLLKTAKFIMRQAIDHLLGGRLLKSRALYPIKQKQVL